MLSTEVINTQNYDNTVIDVEFIVIHYTAGSLDRTLELFTSNKRKVSAHIIIDLNGKVIELVPCLNGAALRAWHAGNSRWFDGKKLWENFNDFSIGIELVNFNGNMFEYTTQQYHSLELIVNNLKQQYPALASAKRIIGHEQISGWRGKADPGCMFNWKLLFDKCYPRESPHPIRNFIIPNDLKRSLLKFLPFKPKSNKDEAKFWNALSDNTETAIKLINQSSRDTK